MPDVFSEDFAGTAYYDEEKNVLVVNGTEYPPRPAENPERLQGIRRAGATLFETLNPYAGNGLFMVSEIEGGLTIGVIVLLLYALKAAAPILLPLCRKQKNTLPDPD